MRDKEELDILELWFGKTLIQSFKVLPKVFKNPKQANREMNRLKRHSDYQLNRTLELTGKGVKQ